jgi:hypothetical protein
MIDHITVKGHDGTFTAYIARPEELPAPAVIVLQELFGVNADIREKCDELAFDSHDRPRAGYDAGRAVCQGNRPGGHKNPGAN